MSTILSIANQKGGVGKTTTTINLGAALAEKGHPVLLVDLDPQAALSHGLGVQADALRRTVYDALVDGDRDTLEMLYPVRDGIDLLPAHMDLAAAEIELVNVASRESVLKAILEPVLPRYRFVLIDCGPSLGLLTLNALTASDAILIPLQCEYFALRLLGALLNTVTRVRARLNPALAVAGVLPTMYQTGTRHAEEVLRQARDLFDVRVFDIQLRKSIRFAEASAQGKTLLEYAPNHEGAHAYRRLAEVIIHDYSQPD